MCTLPLTQGTGTGLLPLTGWPASAGSGWPSTVIPTEVALVVVQVSVTSVLAPEQVTALGALRVRTTGRVTGFDFSTVLTVIDSEIEPSPVAVRVTSWVPLSHAIGTLPLPVVG